MRALVAGELHSSVDEKRYLRGDGSPSGSPAP